MLTFTVETDYSNTLENGAFEPILRVNGESAGAVCNALIRVSGTGMNMLCVLALFRWFDFSAKCPNWTDYKPKFLSAKNDGKSRQGHSGTGSGADMVP